MSCIQCHVYNCNCARRTGALFLAELEVLHVGDRSLYMYIVHVSASSLSAGARAVMAMVATHMPAVVPLGAYER